VTGVMRCLFLLCLAFSGVSSYWIHHYGENGVKLLRPLFPNDANKNVWGKAVPMLACIKEGDKVLLERFISLCTKLYFD